MTDWQAPPPGGYGTLQQALALHQQGRLDDAERIYSEVLRSEPRQLDALHLLGLLKLQQGRHADAERLLATALEVEPNSPVILANYGHVLAAQGRFEEALASYDRALAANPEHVDAHLARGNVMQALSRHGEAVASYTRALALNPNHAEAHYNCGIALQGLNRSAEALAGFDQALKLNPNHVNALNNRGNVLVLLDRPDDALASFERCLALAPNHGLAHYNRGLSLKTMDRLKEAQDSFSRALAINPDHAAARFALCMAQLPPLYADVDEIDRSRAAYQQHLEGLWTFAERDNGLAALAPGVGASQPFYLAYQGHNDRDLQARYGELVCRIMAARFPPAPLSPKPAPGEPVRIGFVSGYFRDHSVWKIPLKGWLANLDRQAFRVFGYHTGTQRDSETEIAAGLCERFVQGPLPLEQWRQEIIADAPHVLIYPELGMHPVCAQLAAQRLAPVQCTSLGHPVTSGYPTVDYFLSSALMEPPDGREHYTERLVELPNLSIYYEPIELVPASVNRSHFGIRPDATAFWCGQSLFKLLPQYDDVFPRIAQEAGNCQFVFIEFQQSAALTDVFRRRLERAFTAHGMRADDHCLVLRRLSRAEFVAVGGLCDVMLDSIGWSGFNSTLESLAHDLPVVTLAGPMARGRHSMAILTRMDVTDTIAATLDDYLAMAVRMAKDPSWRASTRSRTAAGKPKLYRDAEAMAALAAFLDRVTRP